MSLGRFLTPENPRSFQPKMPFFFDCSTPGYEVYMGKDQFENDELIEHGWASDVWFHVDSLSSAHVYLRFPIEQISDHTGPGDLMDLLETIPEVVEEMCQLVKANSIEGCKKASVSVVYTPWTNLRKESHMKEGQVGFHDSAFRKTRLTEKDKSAIKTIEATRREVWSAPLT